jgi:hypothetical protein
MMREYTTERSNPAHAATSPSDNELSLPQRRAPTVSRKSRRDEFKQFSSHLAAAPTSDVASCACSLFSATMLPPPLHGPLERPVPPAYALPLGRMDSGAAPRLLPFDTRVSSSTRSTLLQRSAARAISALASGHPRGIRHMHSEDKDYPRCIHLRTVRSSCLPCSTSRRRVHDDVAVSPTRHNAHAFVACAAVRTAANTTSNKHGHKAACKRRSSSLARTWTTP